MRLRAAPVERWVRDDGTIVAPLAAAGIFLVALATQFRRILDVLYWNSDITFMPLLTEDLEGLTDAGSVNMGNNPYFSTQWLLTLTKDLPFYRLVWDVGPYLLALAAAGLVAWTTYRIAGRWAAAVTFSVTVGAAPSVLLTQVVPGVRVVTWFSIAVLASYLIHLTTAEREPGRARPLLLGGTVAVVAGTTAGSDPLFLVGGLVPFLIAPMIAWALGRSSARARVALTALAVGVVAAGVGYFTGAWMRAQGFAATFPREGFQFATEDQFLLNLRTMAESLLHMGNGAFFGRPLGPGALLRLIMAAVVGATVVVAASQVRRTMRTAGEEPGNDQGTPVREALTLWVLFWGLGAAAVLGAILSSTIAAGAGVATTRYLVPVFYALAALVPIWARNSELRRIAVTVGAVLFVALSVRELAGFYRGADQVPLISNAPAVREYLDEHGLTRGYGGYWTAHAFTWNNDLQVRVYPVHECRRPDSDVLCPFHLAVRDSWFEPQDGPSFLLVDESAFGALSETPSAIFGPPARVEEFGELTVYVYDHDIAEDFEHSSARP